MGLAPEGLDRPPLDEELSGPARDGYRLWDGWLGHVRGDTLRRLRRQGAGSGPASRAQPSTAPARGRARSGD
ncbi:MAG: hypothetical protein CL573_08840, partial [Alphaproteobacteria bacterium]|nr:hypothetical protein [Alphaproteobacteria bacterium]